MLEVSLWRINILRAYYALMAFGTIAVFWPSLLVHGDEWAIRGGAQYALLCALSPFALLGLKYPLKMLPIILYEFVWKALWFIFIVAPLWLHDQLTPEVISNIYACSIAIVLTPIIVPWNYLWSHYVTSAGEPWASAR